MDRCKWHTHTMECYSAIKRTGFLVHATTQLNCETLSEKSQTQKVTCCMSPLILNTQNRQICRSRKQICSCYEL